MGWRWVKVVRQWTGCLFLALVVILAHGGIAEAASKTGTKASTAVCKPSSDKAASGYTSDDDNEDDDNDDEGIRFRLAGACAKLTGGVSYTYQKAQQTASGLPLFVNRNGTVSRGTSSNSVSANIGLETARPTALGEFKTSVGAEWSKATDDDTRNGSASVSGWSVGLGGLTVGYTGSLIGFWEGDFLSSANAPGRSASTIVYEYAVNGDNKVSVGLESNLPTTPQSETGIKNFEFSDPVYTARWRYETDPLTFQTSGLVRQADFSNSPLLPRFSSTATTRTGWVASIGFKVPVAFVAEDDEFNMQATYAVDAVSYLGLNNDLTVYQNTVRSTGPTKGWSVVGSFHHVWSEQFESNVFASFMTVQADLLLAKPKSETFRGAINLFWKPIDHLKFGVELGYVDIKLDPQGDLGFFNGVGGRSYIGIFSVSAEL
jgi:hypothetical protein